VTSRLEDLAARFEAKREEAVQFEREAENPTARQYWRGRSAGYAVARDMARADAAERAGDGPWRPELTGAHRLAKDREGDVTINVPTAMCWLQFSMESSTGTEDDTRPGVGFALVAYPGSSGEWPVGVVPRSEVAKLHRSLGRFLEKFPPPGGAE
jgi:hypothetical protein